MITTTTNYSGTVEGFKMFKKFEVAKETKEVYDEEANTRRQEETGGLIVSTTFEVGGKEQKVSKVVTPAQVGQLTLQQLLDASVVLLENALGV